MDTSVFPAYACEYPFSVLESDGKLQDGEAVGVEGSGSQTPVHQNPLEGLLQHRWLGPPPEFQIQWVWGRDKNN